MQFRTQRQPKSSVKLKPSEPISISHATAKTLPQARLSPQTSSDAINVQTLNTDMDDISQQSFDEQLKLDLNSKLELSPANLPPRQIISRCLASCFRGYGTLLSLCREADIMNVFQALYSITSISTNVHNATAEKSRNDVRKDISNIEFALLLLTAAVGGLYIEDADIEVREARVEFFRIGKLNLDSTFRGEIVSTTADESDTSVITPHSIPPQLDDQSTQTCMSASAMAALYLVFEKEISARKYIGMITSILSILNYYYRFSFCAGSGDETSTPYSYCHAQTSGIGI